MLRTFLKFVARDSCDMRSDVAFLSCVLSRLSIMSTTTFNTLATFQIPSSCRILPASCCLDKDLVVLISRLGSLDRISLWNTTQGTKIWEVEVGGDVHSTHVVDLAWSPDGTPFTAFWRYRLKSCRAECGRSL